MDKKETTETITGVQTHEYVKLLRDCKAIQVPDGNTVDVKKDANVYVQQCLGGSFTVITDEGLMVRIAGKDADALGGTFVNPLQKHIESGASVKDMVWEQLRTCFDPEVPVNIVDLGLVYDCKVEPIADASHRVAIRMTLTAPGCGMGEVLKNDVEEKVAEIPGVKEVAVDLVFEPIWTREMMTDAAKLQLGLL